MVLRYDCAKLGACVALEGQSRFYAKFCDAYHNSWVDAAVLQACVTCPRLRPHRASQSPPGREVRTTVRGVRSPPVADVSTHLHPSYSGAGVSSAAQCDRVPADTASALQSHCMQAGRPALWPTCPSRALLCVSACVDAVMSSSTVAPPHSVTQRPMVLQTHPVLAARSRPLTGPQCPLAEVPRGAVAPLEP